LNIILNFYKRRKKVTTTTMGALNMTTIYYSLLYGQYLNTVKPLTYRGQQCNIKLVMWIFCEMDLPSSGMKRREEARGGG
jgi:hypothetical protein